MNFFENITMRRTRTKSDSSTVINQSQNDTFENTLNSLPDLSSDDINDAHQQITKLKERIDKLVLELNSAHQEIESLSLENNDLKQINIVLRSKNNHLTELTHSPIKKHKKTTPIKKCPENNKQTQTDPSFISNQKEVTTLNKTSSVKTIPEQIQQPINSNSQLSSSNTTPNIRAATTTEQSFTKHKICLLSSETSNRLYTIAERTTLRNYEICHYRKPTCGLRQILHKIEGKVQNFTHSDYCVIYIGEEDFRKTHNYLELVIFIRETLIELSHTNFIICLPTFKYMIDANLMYNSRVETFNNLIYLDINTCNYAYLLDSNSNLSYDYDTYSKRYGTLNSSGLNIVMSDLQNLILSQCNLNATNSGEDCHPQNHSQHEFSNNSQQSNSQFFR